MRYTEYIKQLKECIARHSDLINNRDFQKLYDANSIEKIVPNYVLTDFLSKYNIDPLKELSKIPEEFIVCVNKLMIPKNIKKISDVAFACVSINDLTFEKDSKCSSIGCRAFMANDLSFLALPDSLRRLGDYAFSSCVALRTLVLPQNLLSIGEGVFENSGIKHLYYRGSVQDFNRVKTLLGANIEDFETNEVHCSDGTFILTEK